MRRPARDLVGWHSLTAHHEPDDALNAARGERDTLSRYRKLRTVIVGRVTFDRLDERH